MQYEHPLGRAEIDIVAYDGNTAGRRGRRVEILAIPDRRRGIFDIDHFQAPPQA